MTPMAKKTGVLAAAVAVLLVTVWLWHISHTPEGANTQNVADFDQFQQDLAARVLKQFGATTDFSVIVATTAYPIGTLLRATGSVPANLDDCVPSTLPKAYPAQRLFPSYTMSSNTALNANLGSRALRGLDSAGVNLQQTQNVQYAIADTAIQIMDDKSVENVTTQGNCGSYISSHPGMRLVRGAVIGKMTFTIKVNNPASVKAQLAKLGGFSIDDDPAASTLSIADGQNEPIVELLSEFSTGPITSRSPARPKALEAAAPPANPSVSRPDPLPVPAPVGTHIYVQADTRETEASAAKIVGILKAKWPTADVASKVERIPSQKMPPVAQVRYFTQSDAAIADKCVSILKEIFPNVRAVRIGLPSPKGQLEVWLPRATHS